MKDTWGDTLLEVINRHVFEVDLLGTVDVGGIGENADGHARAGNVGEPAISDGQLL